MTISTADQPPESAALEPFHNYDGSTYYGRSQLKPAPFENLVVGGYIFLAGLSGAVAILAALSDATRREDLKPVSRRGRYLALLAPVLGAPLLIYDLHTPKRFYNMLRVAKSTSPMSIGTWILMAFSACAGIAAVSQAGADLKPRSRWFGWLARRATIPAAIAGAGLSTYTASLLSATSTPVWAAAPRSLAARFGASSMVAAAAALSLTGRNGRARGKLDAIQAGALVTEAVATAISHRTYARAGIASAFEGRSGAMEGLGATGLGVVLPLGLLAASALLPRGGARLSGLASVTALAGSALLRIAIMSVGDESASRPDVSFRFSTPQNLPERIG